MMTDDLAATSGALGVHIDGILGNDIIRKFPIKLDYSVGSVMFGRVSVAPTAFRSSCTESEVDTLPA
jgi:uncharacterized membrane protein